MFLYHTIISHVVRLWSENHLIVSHFYPAFSQMSYIFILCPAFSRIWACIFTNTLHFHTFALHFHIFHIYPTVWHILCIFIHTLHFHIHPTVSHFYLAFSHFYPALSLIYSALPYKIFTNHTGFVSFISSLLTKFSHIIMIPIYSSSIHLKPWPLLLEDMINPTRRLYYTPSKYRYSLHFSMSYGYMLCRLTIADQNLKWGQSMSDEKQLSQMKNGWVMMLVLCGLFLMVHTPTFYSSQQQGISKH